MGDYTEIRRPQDPYCYDDTNVLINKQGIRDRELLGKIEAAYACIAMHEICLSPIEGAYDFDHLCKFHDYLFKDVYSWAGTPRTTAIMKREEILEHDSVEYAHPLEIVDSAKDILNQMNSREWKKMSLDEQAAHLASDMAKLWKVHPFREGNTRTMIAFTCQFAESKGMLIDRSIFVETAGFARSSLVLACAKGKYSIPSSLRNIVKFSLEEGLKKNKNQQQKMSMGDWKSQISRMKENNNSKKGEQNTKMKNAKDER